MSDILERLRAVHKIRRDNGALCHEAADEIERLRAEVAALRAARQRVVLTVEEIADLAGITDDMEPDERYVIEPAIPEGFLDEDTGVTTRYRFVAYHEDHPEAGVFALGPPLEDQGRE